MADTAYLGKVFDTLTEPVRERPASSLIFFAALLTAAYFGQRFVTDQLRPYFVALVVILFAAAILCLHRLLVMREGPSRLKNPAVLEKIKESFVGRDDDAKALTEIILDSYQVWLNGDSGVGKSVLLQKAVLPEFERRGVSAVYLNSWRGDWELAPAKAVLAKLNETVDGDVLARLAQALTATPGRVIILDQFDEFQIEHRDKFIPERGQVISRAQLAESNQFFRILNSAIREQRIRCVFVTRRDVEWGKRAVLFDEADEFFLKRLERNLVESEIAKVVPAEAVEHPEKGWEALRERLCNDLADDGILPVQMRFAVLGLDELRHNLTVSAYLRIGAVSGLISRYIEREVRRVAGDRSLTLELFPVLDRLVTPDGKATVAIPEEELLTPVPDGLKSAMMKALQELERHDIVRRVLNPDGTVLWRLDHDYLAGSVREISRRQLPEQWELKDRLQRYVAAPVWQKPSKLADPFSVIRLARARLFKGLRFGPAFSWFLFSVSACWLVLAGITYLGFGGYQWFADRELGRRLFDVFGQETIGGETTSLAEAKALPELEGSRLTTREAFLQTALDSGQNATRLNSHLFPIALALTRGHSATANELYHSEIRPSILQAQSDADVLRGAFGLMSFWGTASTLSAQETQKLATTLVERMSKETNFNALRALAEGLGALKDKIEPATIQSAATTLVERMSKETNYVELFELAGGLGALKDKIEPATAQKLATTLVERMSKETKFDALSEFAAGLGALKDNIEPATAQKLATTLVERMSKETDSGALRELAEGLGALKDKIEPATIQSAATTLVERMSKETNSFALSELAEGLGALKDKIEPATIQSAATTLVERMSKETNSFALSELAAGLGALKDKIEPATAQKLAATLVERMSKETNSDALSELAAGLGALKDKIEPATIQSAAATLVERMSKETNSGALRDLAAGLGALKDKIEPATAQKLATTLVERMSKETNSGALSALAAGLGALRDKIEPATIRSAVATLVERMSKETNSGALREFAAGVGALKDKIEPATAQKLATTLVERMSKETNSDALRALAGGLGALKDKIEPATAQKLATTLVERMSKETNSDALRGLAEGLSSFPEGSLDQKDLTPVFAALTIPNAPCSVLFAFDSTTQQDELPKQLRNPLCREHDWKQLALRAGKISRQPLASEETVNESQIAGKVSRQPLASEETVNESQIVVDFPKLSDYLSSQESGFDRLRPSLPEITALVLLVLAMIAFVLALVKSSDQRFPATSL